MKIHQHLTAAEAWADFEAEILPSLGSLTDMPDLRKAKQTARGTVKKKNRYGAWVPVQLGWKRVKRLLEKYAPGRYEFHEGEPYFV